MLQIKMIKEIRFRNFRVLRDTALPLGPFTLIVGANGSGKSTAMRAFDFVSQKASDDLSRIVTAGQGTAPTFEVSIQVLFETNRGDYTVMRRVKKENNAFLDSGLEGNDKSSVEPVRNYLRSFRIFSFDAAALSRPVETNPAPELGCNGAELAAVLDALRDSHPEQFEQMNKELHRWLPQFDRVLFETPEKGRKTFLLRTSGGHRFYPSELSNGELFALAFLALAYLPKPPAIVCFEEPDRGIHPRLLRDIQDAMYRLAFPANYGELRNPVQVIATTHSPYLVDLYKEHPEQIVIAHKASEGVKFERLSDRPHIDDILNGAPLGEVWFSGVLGGVPPAQ